MSYLLSWDETRLLTSPAVLWLCTSTVCKQVCFSAGLVESTRPTEETSSQLTNRSQLTTCTLPQNSCSDVNMQHRDSMSVCVDSLPPPCLPGTLSRDWTTAVTSDGKTVSKALKQSSLFVQQRSVSLCFCVSEDNTSDWRQLSSGATAGFSIKYSFTSLLNVDCSQDISLSDRSHVVWYMLQRQWGPCRTF